MHRPFLLRMAFQWLYSAVCLMIVSMKKDTFVLIVRL